MARWWNLALFMVLLAFWLLPANPTKAEENSIRVAVITADSLTSTKRTVNGVRKKIKRKFENVVFTTFQLQHDNTKDQGIVDSITEYKPKLIITVGSSATKLAQRSFTDIPIVFSAVMYPKLSGFVQSNQVPGGNLTGASLNIPVDIQFKYFQKIVPNLKRVGVLYTDNTETLIEPARKAAGKRGIELIPYKVNLSKDIPKALDSLATTVDGIWSVADPMLFTPQSTRYILLNTLRKRIPFMGFSRYVVESGALFALDFDYKAIGYQAGTTANRILGGANPANIPVTSVDVIWFHYNEKTAQHLKITIPEELMAVAKEVYR